MGLEPARPTTNGTSILPSRSLYWFEDATLTVRIEDIQFRVHQSLIARHSPLFGSVNASLDLNRPTDVLVVSTDVLFTTNDPSGHRLIAKETVAASDFEVLLAHLYHDEPLTTTSSLQRVASILRVSGSNQLHFPSIHGLARGILEGVIPADPLLLKSDSPSPFEALSLATQFDVWPVRKCLLYWLVTTHHFDDGTSSEGPQATSSESPSASSSDRALCERLLGNIIEHFTPILYTPATGSHMAYMWMPHVIQLSFEDDGVYKPLETLERIKQIDWEAQGICSSCAGEKRREWSEEQEIVWRKVDEWVGHCGN
ncbi:hypothetical protein BKA70DRAFT_1334902 [Coprinopsis sp. MPI-PUGE-AT-0042]|nr:hypothetical protein BKA70DRAFT_1334902 [Coprinopsis sp. MPI-PUGE-AT-0042]